MVERLAPYVIALVGAPLLVLVSLLVPTKVHTPSEARAIAYGYPFSFATSRDDTAPGVYERAETQEARTYYPSWEPFNPWENPTSGDAARFAASSGTVAAVLFLVLFVARALRRRRSSPPRPAPA
jgi:hypothetical protein